MAKPAAFSAHARRAALAGALGGAQSPGRTLQGEIPALIDTHTAKAQAKRGEFARLLRFSDEDQIPKIVFRLIPKHRVASFLQPLLISSQRGQQIGMSDVNRVGSLESLVEKTNDVRRMIRFEQADRWGRVKVDGQFFRSHRRSFM
jgi:hypothetical protein